jgi:hypothetical protein
MTETGRAESPATIDRVLVEVLVAAPIETVWNALRDKDEIRRWFGWEYAGFEDELSWIVTSGQIASETDRVIHIQGMSDRFVLESRGDRATVLRVIRSAPADARGPAAHAHAVESAVGPEEKGWAGIYDDTVEGWTSFIQMLRLMVERHPGEDRRTLYFSGRSRAADAPKPPEAVGLDAIASLPIGARYSLTLATGETISGDVWYRSEHQVGLTVDSYGNGLLVVARRPITAKSPHGGGTALISAYGLSDAALADVRAKWTAWWHANYDVQEIQPEA